MNIEFPFFPESPATKLDGLWNFKWLGDNIPETINTIEYDEKGAVPGVFDLSPLHVNEKGAAAYQTEFSVAESGRYEFYCGGAGLAVRFYIDNQLVAESLSAYSPFSAIVSLAEGKHTIVAIVDSRFESQKSSLFHTWADFWGYGGIYRSVTLRKLPENGRIERVAVFTKSIETGTVELEIATTDLADGIYSFDIEFDGPTAGSGINKSAYSLEIVNGKAKLELQVPDFKVWSLESPNLHLVRVWFNNQSIVTRFGIRTITTDKQKILLNGKPVFLKGVNKHEAHPELGPVQNTQLLLDDLIWAKKLGCNFIRCVHYTHDSRMFDFCDELGLLVWEESLGWGNPTSDFLDEKVLEEAVEATKQMVWRDINHPSIIMWAFINEGDSAADESIPFYTTLVNTIRGMDASRLVTYACNRTEHDKCFDLVDVISINRYPGWCGPFANGVHYLDFVKKDIPYLEKLFAEKFTDKPLIMSETGTCGIFGKHDYGRAQWTEEFQCDFLEAIVTPILNSSRITGIAIWQFFDSKSYVNQGQIRCKPFGTNLAGLLDEYRRPKQSFYLVQKLYGGK